MPDFEPTPSTLHVFWPWAELPTEVEIELALGSSNEGEEMLESDDPDVQWVGSFRLPEFPVPVLIWCSRIDEPPDTIDADDVHWEDDERERVKSTRWMIGVETVLDPDDLLGSYQRQLKLCRKVCPDSPAIYDSNSYCLRSGSLVDRMTETEVPPRNSELFRIHAVCSEDSEDTFWIHTHGLSRAMFPDVEIVGVPSDLARAGTWLVRNVVDRLLGEDLPPPHAPFEVGHQISLAWRDWQDVVADLPFNAPGGRDDRDDDDEHGGARIVLVGSKPKGWLRKRWEPPIGILEQIENEGAVATISREETVRMAHMARERWHELGMLFARHGAEEDWTFLVKLGYRVDDGEPHEQEHLWFEIREIIPDRLRGRLLNTPIRIERMSEEQEDWHNLESLTDWRIYSPVGEFTPETVRYVRGSNS